MNLFGGGKTPAPTPLPQIDEARQRVDEQRRGRLLRGRAASMITAGAQQAPTAQRATTGN
jgi:hypothetical protein